ncbi:MAG TPA: apolipoprotein N-acyltransferase [Candidatus Sulfotelmatobacter sp.]|nr:apolipoprotein N-acyltransferase [Candidatus Sulfotelmatobacter sp.]
MRQIHPSAWLLVVLSALLQVLIFPLPNFYLLSWFAVAPLIVALSRARPAGALEVEGAPRFQPATPMQGFLLGYACGILWYAGNCYWVYGTMRQYGGLNAPMAFLVLFLFCCYLGLYHGAFGALLPLFAKGRDYRRPLFIAPFLWVALELARTRITGFPWDILGTAQVDNAPLCRIAVATGVYGISLEIMLVNVALAAAFLVPREKRGSMLAAAFAAAAVLQTGKLIEAPPAHADRAAILVQQNIPVSADWSRPGYLQQTLNQLKDLTERGVAAQAAGKVGIVVWPESPAPFFTNDPRFRDAVSTIARDTHTWMVTGAIGSDAKPYSPDATVYNSAALVGPDGQWTARYDKVHLVPFGEYLPFPSLFAFAGGLTKEVGQFAHGASRTPLNAGGEPIGVFICYESVFPDEVRQFANHGAQVLVNISNDGWYGDSGAYAQHLNQTRMRAIENNRWLLSTADTGVTASIDPIGRIAAQVPRKQMTTLLAPYALTSVTTFYTQHGDWFAFACAIISLGALLERFTFSKTREKADTSS